MRYFTKIFCLLAIVLVAGTAMAQPRGGKRPKPNSHPKEVIDKQKEAEKIGFKEDTTTVVDNFVMPENAPYFNGADDKMYHLRKVNIHGVKHIDHDIIRSSSGLVPGDSIYLSGSFIQNAMMRLWSQRYFEDIQIGATIEGDSVDLEVMLRERPRVMNWAVTGVSKGKGKDLIDETLKLKRGHELSDHIIDRNIKLLKEHFGEKGFLDCEIDVKVEPDTVIKQAVNVTFDVKKNQRIRIGEIFFEGNENFDDKRLARTFQTIENLMAADVVTLTAANEIGERIAGSVVDFFSVESNRELVRSLQEAGLKFAVDEESTEARSETLKGLSIVISGVFEKHSRDEYKNMIEMHGGKNVGSVSKSTSFILAGANMGPSKLEKAQKLNVPLKSEDEFLEMIGEN